MTHIEDLPVCIRIQAILLNKGWESTLRECQDAWSQVSGAYDAQWLEIDKYTDNEILTLIETYTNFI